MTGLPPTSAEDIGGDVESVISYALDGDADGVLGTVNALVRRHGVGAAYGVARGLAAAMIGDDTPATGSAFWALDFPEIDTAGYDARWVARFVSAYVNADDRTGAALFGAAVADGQLDTCLAALAGSTVATLRRRAEEH